MALSGNEELSIEILELWIRPYWSTTNIREVRTVAVEHWLSHLRRQYKEPLSSSTKAKIRSLMSVLFNHAIRYEWLEQGKNPITLVRQSAERLKTPEVREPSEIERLLSILQSTISPYGTAGCNYRIATKRIVRA